MSRSDEGRRMAELAGPDDDGEDEDFELDQEQII